MTILNPSAFYLLLLLGIILFFYLLKGRPRKVIVSSTLFWRRIRQALPAQRPRWRLPPELLLFLQIALLTLLIMALAQFLLSRKEKKEFIVIVMDTTASMQATDLIPNRLAVAKKRAQEFIEELPENTQLALVQAGKRPQLIANFSDERSYLLIRLKALTAADVRGNEAAVLELANSILPTQTQGRVIFFTDGAFELDLDSLPQTVELVPLDKKNSRNLAITSFELRPRTEDSEKYELLVKVTNFSLQKERFSLRLWLGQNLIFKSESALSSQEEKKYIHNLEVKEKTILKAEIYPYPQDDLAIDNTAYALPGFSERLNVLLVSRGNLFLKATLESYPQVNLYQKQTILPEELSGYDLIIFDNIVPPPLKRGNIVCLGVLPPNLSLEEQDPQPNPILTEWQIDHPLLRFVNLKNMNVRQSLGTETLPEADILLRSSAGPLIQVWQSGGLRLLFIGFDLYYSDFPLQIGFPIFIFNLLRWFHPQVFDPTYSQIQTGEEFVIFPKAQKEEITIVNPHNEIITIEDPKDPLIFSETTIAGVYTLDGKSLFAANLLSAHESNLLSRVTFSAASREVNRQVKNEYSESKLSLSPMLILLSCLLLFIEWYLYHFPGAIGKKKSKFSKRTA